MAETDRKKWLQLLQTYFGYKLPSALRKSKYYLGRTSLEDALETTNESGFPCSIHIVIAFTDNSYLHLMSKRTATLADCVVIYPQFVRVRYPGKKTVSIAEVEKPIQFGRTLYSIDKFIRICPRLNDYFELGNYNCFSLPLNFFLITTREFVTFDRAYLNQIRRLISKTALSASLQGKFKGYYEYVQERNDYILEQHRQLGHKERIPITEIQDRLSAYAQSKYSNTPKALKIFDCNDMTVRRVINPASKSHK